MQQQAALTSGYLSRDQTLDSNPLRSLSKDIAIEKKQVAASVVGTQSQSNSTMLRKSNKALKPNGPTPSYSILSDRDGMVVIQSDVQEEYAFLPKHSKLKQQDQSEAFDQSFDISIKDDIVKSCNVSQKW
jgi:hypothetical protein